MILYEELYFEITAYGAKSDVKKLAAFLKSGELDDFFEIDSDYISYDDKYSRADDEDSVELVFSNDEMGVEIDSFDTEEFLDVFCKVAKNLDVSGYLYDADDNEFNFTSPEGDVYYYDSKAPKKFNDELDNVALEEEADDEEEE